MFEIKIIAYTLILFWIGMWFITGNYRRHILKVYRYLTGARKT